MTENRRANPRHDVDLPATATVDGERHELRIKNLSLGGAGVETSLAMATGSSFSLSFRLPAAADPIVTEATVRWVNGEMRGLQFAGLRAREVYAVNKYLEGKKS